MPGDFEVIDTVDPIRSQDEDHALPSPKTARNRTDGWTHQRHIKHAENTGLLVREPPTAFAARIEVVITDPPKSDPAAARPVSICELSGHAPLLITQNERLHQCSGRPTPALRLGK